jgi:hypothetical protein
MLTARLMVCLLVLLTKTDDPTVRHLLGWPDSDGVSKGSSLGAADNDGWSDGASLG